MIMRREQRMLADTLPPWWLLLITGVGWTLVAIILLRFDYTSVSSISLLFGFVALAAGFMEIGMIFLAAGWWKLLNGILALVFIVAGVVAFIHPGDPFGCFRPYLKNSSFICVKPNAQSATAIPRITFQIVITESWVIEKAATVPVAT